ncbi:YcxB family protein [Nonomuraea sp. FMUSA5-5]|uniref:YcxB family protein n=1 Tax=Nonomuraea composti TaxID=2720023 RepID=A0ABX1BMR2_9ACTN|nr:YcxB family protein [Nonomuraea sp. FMUSA5-5]NJP98312.1 YcxB family protein [Nonomuraea sp. FMUSA5-5]
MDFTVEYEPTPDQVVGAIERALKHQIKALLWLFPAFLAVAGAVFLLLGTIGLGLGLLVAAAVVPFVMPWSLRRAARKQVPHLCVPTTLHVTDDGYESRSEKLTTSARWSLFSRVVATPDFWLFFVNNQATGFLPRNAFTPEQQAELDARLSPLTSPRKASTA